jgi:hypothetical protein
VTNFRTMTIHPTVKMARPPISMLLGLPVVIRHRNTERTDEKAMLAAVCRKVTRRSLCSLMSLFFKASKRAILRMCFGRVSEGGKSRITPHLMSPLNFISKIRHHNQRRPCTGNVINIQQARFTRPKMDIPTAYERQNMNTGSSHPCGRSLAKTIEIGSILADGDIVKRSMAPGITSDSTSRRKNFKYNLLLSSRAMSMPDSPAGMCFGLILPPVLIIRPQIDCVSVCGATI